MSASHVTPNRRRKLSPNNSVNNLMQKWAPVAFTDLVFVFHYQSGVFHSFLKQFQNFVMKDLPTSFHLFIFYLMLFHSLLFFIICASFLYYLRFFFVWIGFVHTHTDSAWHSSMFLLFF